MVANKTKANTKTPPKKKTVKPPVEHVKFVLRIPPQLHSKIKKQAKGNFQSMNEFITQGMSTIVEPKNSLPNLIRRLEKKGVI